MASYYQRCGPPPWPRLPPYQRPLEFGYHGILVRTFRLGSWPFFATVTSMLNSIIKVPHIPVGDTLDLTVWPARTLMLACSVSCVISCPESWESHEFSGSIFRVCFVTACSVESLISDFPRHIAIRSVWRTTGDIPIGYPGQFSLCWCGGW